MGKSFWASFLSEVIDALDDEFEAWLFGSKKNVSGDNPSSSKRNDPFSAFEEQYARYWQYQQQRNEYFYDEAHKQKQQHQAYFSQQELQYYARLEVPVGASFEDIRKAYKRLMKQYHPDRFYQDERKRRIAEEICRKLNEAYAYFEKKYAHP